MHICLFGIELFKCSFLFCGEQAVCLLLRHYIEKLKGKKLLETGLPDARTTLFQACYWNAEQTWIPDICPSLALPWGFLEGHLEHASESCITLLPLYQPFYFTFCTKPPLAPDVTQHTEEKHLQENTGIKSLMSNKRTWDCYSTVLCCWFGRQKRIVSLVCVNHSRTHSVRDGQYITDVSWWAFLRSRMFHTQLIKQCFPNIMEGPSIKDCEIRFRQKENKWDIVIVATFKDKRSPQTQGYTIPK